MDQFDGDLALILTQDGGDVYFTGGQPQMDAGGLETAVNISLFTGPNWWGNALELNNPDNQLGSIFEKTCQPGAITIQRLRLIKQEAENALEWMNTSGIAEFIEVGVKSPELNKIDIDILITKKDGDTVKIKYDLNWKAGYLMPVTARIE